MAIIFAEFNSTVLLPSQEPLLIPPENARKALANNRAIRTTHFYPLFDATASFAVSLLMVRQGCEAFELPRGPWIILIGDDMLMAWGPRAFGAAALDAAICAADNCVLITSGPDPFPYRYAASLAVKPRKNVLLIESLPHQQEPWQDRIRNVRGENTLPVFCCMPLPETSV